MFAIHEKRNSVEVTRRKKRRTRSCYTSQYLCASHLQMVVISRLRKNRELDCYMYRPLNSEMWNIIEIKNTEIIVVASSCHLPMRYSSVYQVRLCVSSLFSYLSPRNKHQDLIPSIRISLKPKLVLYSGSNLTWC